MKVLVTGCLGFIGSHFVKYTLKYKPEVSIRGFSRFSSATNMLRLKDANDSSRFELLFGDLTGDVSGIMEGVDVVVNFAAKTFVDHSIRDPHPFINSNILGTYNLLEQARKYGLKCFVQISTDEVYGSILEGAYKEDDRLNPTNPYAAAKAAADMLVISYGNSFGLPYIITRTENNYGSFQHPQKAFPTFVKKALENEPLPVYGDGLHRRMWLRVEDHCSAVWHLIDCHFQGAPVAKEKHGYPKVSGIYHVAGEQELTNIDLARTILRALGKKEDQIKYIEDFNIRPGHDRRYALDCSKLRGLGWKPAYNLAEGIEEVVEWYAENTWWLK